MRIEISQRNEATVLVCSESLDAISVNEFEEACRLGLETGATRLIVDLGGLEYISSAGLRGILKMEKESRAIGSRIVFCAMSGMVEDMFRLSGFYSILNTSPKLEEAFEQ